MPKNYCHKWPNRQNDNGDFAEAVRARIAELNAKIEALSLAVEREQVIARINYLLTQANSKSIE